MTEEELKDKIFQEFLKLDLYHADEGIYKEMAEVAAKIALEYGSDEYLNGRNDGEIGNEY